MNLLLQLLNKTFVKFVTLGICFLFQVLLISLCFGYLLIRFICLYSFDFLIGHLFIVIIKRQYMLFIFSCNTIVCLILNLLALRCLVSIILSCYFYFSKSITNLNLCCSTIHCLSSIEDLALKILLLDSDCLFILNLNS